MKKIIGISECTVFGMNRKTNNHGGGVIYVNVKKLRSNKLLEDLNCCGPHDQLGSALEKTDFPVNPQLL